MGSGSSLPRDKHIVIVGAGYAGINLAVGLDKLNANYTIINPSDCFQHNIAAVRAVVIPGYGEKVCIPLEPKFGEHFKKAKLVGVNPQDKKVTLDTEEEISYDILVIATGLKQKPPIKATGVDRDDGLTMFNKEAEKVKAAQKLMIVGGGATGVEVAAEVASEYPEKEVTLVHNSETLVAQTLNERSQRTLRNILENDLKIKLLIGEKVTNLADLPEEGPYTLTTEKGTNIEADYVLDAIGLKIDSSPYENGLAASMEENGSLKVNEFLQVEGHEDIYAMGDCTNLKEPKIAYLAMEQAKVLLKTLKSLLTGGKAYPYKEDGAPVAVIMSLGPKRGFAQTKGGMNVPSFLIVSLKSKDMLNGDQWKLLDQKCPK